MHTSVVEQLRSVVEDSGVLSQLAGAGEAEQLGWLFVHLLLLILVFMGLAEGMRQVRRCYGVAPAESGGGEPPRCSVCRCSTGDDFHKWRLFLWISALVLGLLLAVLVVCDAVTLYQYCTYPKAMVLRDILKRI